MFVTADVEAEMDLTALEQTRAAEAAERAHLRTLLGLR
jgi:hypothetical protein